MRQPASQLLLLHTWPLPQAVPSLRVRWRQMPGVLQVSLVQTQTSLVQGLPSSVQAVPAGVGWWTGTPFSQTSSVQGFWSSTGTQEAPPEEAAEVLAGVSPTPPAPVLP